MFVRTLLTLCILAGLAVPSAWGAEARSYTFLPHWLPQAQFAGYFMAHEKGFYKKRDIDVEILRGGPGYPVSETIARSRVDFATTFLSSAIELRSRGVRLVNIGQVVQALNAIGVTPRDLIAILQAIKAAGALQAELQII